MCCDIGKRPSEMICWNEEEDWQERLAFDMDVYAAFMKEKERIMKKAQRGR
jgi:hypothetical protein